MEGERSILFRRVFLFGVPFLYLVLGLLHPPDNPKLGDETGFFIGLHIAQLFLIGGLAYTLWLLVEEVDGRAATLARVLILPFVIVYTALDSVLGIAWGIVTEKANELPAADQAAAGRLVDDLLEPEPLGYILYFGAGVLWLAVALAVVAALWKRAPLPALALMAAGAIVFALGHARPMGPIGMALFLAGIIWLELRPRRGDARTHPFGATRATMPAEAMQRGREPRRAGPAWPMAVPLRRALLLVPPLALAALEIVHPQPHENAQAVMDVATWFALFHVIQLVLIGLVGLSVLLLADSFGRANAWVTRLGVGVFLVFFSAYDAVAGIGTGLAMRSARNLSPVQQEGVFDVVEGWPGLGSPFLLGIIGTAGWVAAVGALALAARRQGAPRLEWIFIGLAALFLMGGHPFVFGTLAFGCLFVAALLCELRGSPTSRRVALRPQGSEQ
jgi:hypothetical protein